jgi:DNA-binding NtrC family response regulator
MIEDDAMVAYVMSETLMTRGYAARAHAYVKSAISMCQTFPELIHLMLTDVSALGSTGLQDWEQFVRNHPEMKVLLTSGRAYSKDVQDLLRDMPYPFIAKPFTSSELLAKLEEACQSQHFASSYCSSKP